MEVPKEDYDFDAANAKFNKGDLIKEAIATGSPVQSPTSGIATNPMDTATNGADGADDVVIPPAVSDKDKDKAGYNKSSSFFDDISSDLKDRMASAGEGVDGRALRREERTRNLETFGQGSVDMGYRGGYRGREDRGFDRRRIQAFAEGEENSSGTVVSGADADDQRRGEAVEGQRAGAIRVMAEVEEKDLQTALDAFRDAGATEVREG